jgi:hypothetical protein
MLDTWDSLHTQRIVTAARFCLPQRHPIGLKMCESRTNIVEAFPDSREDEIVGKTWQLCQKHGNETMMAMQRMRMLHDDLCKTNVKGSLLDLISQRAYLETPVERLVQRISDRLSAAIPLAFRTSPPKNEGVLNDQIEAILQGDRAEFQREFPVVKFGLARAVPDHSVANEDVFIEGKYIRGGTSPSKVSSGIAEDLTKYPSIVHTLFIVYDPNRAIADDAAFSAPFVRHGNCTVRVIR